MNCLRSCYCTHTLPVVVVYVHVLLFRRLESTGSCSRRVLMEIGLWCHYTYNSEALTSKCVTQFILHKISLALNILLRSQSQISCTAINTWHQNWVTTLVSDSDHRNLTDRCAFECICYLTAVTAVLTLCE